MKPILPLIAIDPATGMPIWRQVEAQLRDAILSGRLSRGSRVVGVRSLARELGVARITVSAAYEQLAAEGYLERVVGSGTRVAESLPEPFEFGPLAPAGEPVEERDEVVDLSSARVASDIVSADLWERTLRDAWRDLATRSRSRIEQLPGSDGDPELRLEIARFLGATRGIACRPDSVFVVGSAQAACAAVAELVPAGVRWAVEDPGEPELRSAFARRLSITPVPVDEDGLVTSLLPRAAAGVLVAPSCHVPMAVGLSAGRRRALIDWADETGGLIVETDVAGHLRLDGPPLRPLRADVDHPRLVYVGTFSTLLFPGVRTAFAVVPPALVSRFREVMQTLDRGPGSIEQRALAMFIRDGHLGTHVARMRHVYRDRQQRLIEICRRRLPQVEVRPARYGSVALARVRGLRADDLVEVARGVGVRLETLDRYAIRAEVGERLVLSFARPIGPDVEAALEAVARAMPPMRRRPPLIA